MTSDCIICVRARERPGLSVLRMVFRADVTALHQLSTQTEW
jgi:hypothetical protein